MCCWWRRFDNQDARTDNLDSLDTAGVGTVDFGADWLQQLKIFIIRHKYQFSLRLIISLVRL